MSSFEILKCARAYDKFKHSNDKNSNRLPYSSQLVELLPHRPSLGGTKFSLTLFSLSFHFYFVFFLRTVHTNFPCPEKRIKVDRSDILDPTCRVNFNHVSCLDVIGFLQNFLSCLFSKHKCLLKNTREHMLLINNETFCSFVSLPRNVSLIASATKDTRRYYCAKCFIRNEKINLLLCGDLIVV